MKILSFDLKLIGLIFIVLLFFASNSILARMAIFTQNIDAFSFTFLRIISAMVILLFIYFYKNKKIKIDFKNNYISGFMFFFICNLFFILIYKYGCWYWNFDFICCCSANYDYFSSLFK